MRVPWEVDRKLRVLLPPGLQAPLGESLLRGYQHLVHGRGVHPRRVLRRRLVVPASRRHRWRSPGAYRHQVHSPRHRLFKREAEGRFGARGVVHPHDHRLPGARAAADHHHRAAGVGGEVDRDRAGEHAGEPAQAAVADHQQSRVFGKLPQGGDGRAVHHRGGQRAPVGQPGPPRRPARPPRPPGVPPGRATCRRSGPGWPPGSPTRTRRPGAPVRASGPPRPGAQRTAAGRRGESSNPRPGGARSS